MTSNEQTQLCTLQISNAVGRCRNTIECIPHIGQQKVSFISLQGQHESTVELSQLSVHNVQPSWLKLLRATCFKVRALIDPRNASDLPLQIRVYVVPQQIIAQIRSMSLLLEEETLQQCLEEYPFFIEMLDSYQDRTFRKQLRIANDRLREIKGVDISDQTAEVSSAMMRIRERVDFQLPTTHVPLAYTPIGQGSGLRQNWSEMTFERSAHIPSISGTSVLHLQADALSQAEVSLCTAWKIACMDPMNKGPCTNWFILPHVMFVYVDSVTAEWTTACRDSNMTQAVASNGLMPSDIMNVDVVFVPSSELPNIRNAVAQTVQTMAFALHLQYDEEPKFQNEARMRKMYMSTAQKWNVDERAQMDAPIAWCMPGLVVHDKRSISLATDWTPMLAPNVLLSQGSLDLNRTFKECPEASWSLQLNCPKRWYKSLRFKNVIVNPDIVQVRISQLCQRPEVAAKIRDIGVDDLTIRGNLHAFVSPSQSDQLIQRHYEHSNATLGQLLAGASGQLRRRSVEDSVQSCSICFEPVTQESGYWSTLCSHVFCTTCGPIAFRHWTPAHNAAQVLIDCPACRTSLSSFDTLRIKDGPDQKPKDNLAEAIENETKNLPRRTNVYQLVNLLEKPSETWYKELPRSIHTLIITEVAPEWVHEWSIQILLWAVLSKKNAKVTLVQNPGHKASEALAHLLDN